MIRMPWRQLLSTSWTAARCFAGLVVARGRRLPRYAWWERAGATLLAGLSLPYTVFMLAVVRPWVSDGGRTVLHLARRAEPSVLVRRWSLPVLGALALLSGFLVLMSTVVPSVSPFVWAVPLFLPLIRQLLRIRLGAAPQDVDWRSNLLASRTDQQWAMSALRGHACQTVPHGQSVGFVAATDTLARGYARYLGATRLGPKSLQMRWVHGPDSPCCRRARGGRTAQAASAAAGR